MRGSFLSIGGNGPAAWRGVGLLPTKPQMKYKLLNKYEYVKRSNKPHILPN